MAKNWKESDLEQYTVNNLDKLKSCLFSSSKIEMNLIGTQIKCTFGRIDMLAWAERSLMVIEFKAVHAGEKELGQVMRYSTLIESVIDVYQHMSDVSFNFSSDVPYKVYPVIVAPSFDKKISASNCILIQATPIEMWDGIVFNFDGYEPNSDADFLYGNDDLKGKLVDFERYVAGLAIGDTMRRTINREECLSHLREDMMPPF
jgi:hypothetical protein